MRDEFVKIQEFSVVLIFVILAQNGKLRRKMKALQFLGINPIYEIFWNPLEIELVC